MSGEAVSDMSVFGHHVRVGAVRLERRAVGSRVRRIALALFFASVVVNAALGIYAVLAPDFGETQSKILTTSLCVTGAVIVALACEPAWERGLLGPVPYAGAVLGATGFALAVIGMWSETDNDVYGRLMGTIFVGAAACTIASLLALAHLAKRHHWVFVTALALLTIGASLFALLPWLGDDPPSMYVRGMGVVLIAFAAIAVTVPVLHWVDRGEPDVAESKIHFCPYCGGALAGGTRGATTCPRCGSGFLVRPSRIPDARPLA